MLSAVCDSCKALKRCIVKTFESKNVYKNPDVAHMFPPSTFLHQNVELLPARQMSRTSLSLFSRVWSRAVILLLGLHCTSTWTTRSDTLPACCSSAFMIRCFSLFPVIHSQGEEKQLSEKSLHPPASQGLLPDHLKCNILKAQMEAAFRVSTSDDPPKHCDLFNVSNRSPPQRRRKLRQHREERTRTRPSMTGGFPHHVLYMFTHHSAFCVHGM